ncbi:hypothetical protein EJB05_20273 [Eragrostis curvula]|uniref:WRC domain-containing protein n=1 Tax=Eragrostis curvula TaxID=38414 RepID=A0A5J9UXW3_9POAL|nr:hypothetical protein EJB05_20273 [Eragrostis curvula]
MRIRRRPQGQSLSSLLPTDPPAPQPPLNASPVDRQPELPAAGVKKEQLHPNAATTADLRDVEPDSSAARRAALLPLLPKDNVVECSRGLGAQRGPAADGHRSLENGHHHHMPEPVIKAGDRLANGGVVRAAPLTAVATSVKKEEIVKDEGGGGGNGGGGGIKKRRDPAVLVEGSRCSRVNGRGWRCSQPTAVGYSLCEHHLSKGRARAATVAAGRAAVAGKLGRTEHKPRNASAVADALAPKADVPPPTVPHC